MAKKKQHSRGRSAPNIETALNMTPMIDVVFNLIIFFMVITDMTQQDLEYLILPKAELALEDDGAEAERLVVNVVNPMSELMRGRIDPNRPPIFFEGRQVESLDELRALLRRRADPRTHPEKFMIDKVTPRPPIAVVGGRPLYPSRVPLIIRCDQGQIFGWVQALMQVCTFIPGRDRNAELQDSPLIYKLEIAVAENEASAQKRRGK